MRLSAPVSVRAGGSSIWALASPTASSAPTATTLTHAHARIDAAVLNTGGMSVSTDCD